MNNVIFKSEALWGGDCNAMSSWKMPSVLIEHRIMQNYSFNCTQNSKYLGAHHRLLTINSKQLMSIWLFFRSRVYEAELHDFHIFNFYFSTLHAQHFVRDGKIFFCWLRSGKKKEPTQQESGPRHIYMYIVSVEEKEANGKKGRRGTSYFHVK